VAAPTGVENPPSEVVTVAPEEDDTAFGAPGVTLSLVARTPGVPVVLHGVTGTADRPQARLRVENVAGVPLTGVVVAVTWTPPPGSGPSRRRLVRIDVPVPAGVTRTVPLPEAFGTRLAGVIGDLELAPAGATTERGVWAHSPGPVWRTGAAAVSCADADWNAVPSGTALPDAATGVIVQCAADGRWLAFGDAERAR
jgi:hypothetical protein